LAQGWLANLRRLTGSRGRRIEGAAEMARRGGAVGCRLRGVRIGHAHLHRVLTEVIDRQPETIRTSEEHRVSELFVRYADVRPAGSRRKYFASAVGCGRPGRHSPAGRRRPAGRSADRRGQASHALGLSRASLHRGVVLCAPARRVAPRVHRFLRRVAKASGADDFLVPAGGSGNSGHGRVGEPPAERS